MRHLLALVLLVMVGLSQGCAAALLAAGIGYAVSAGRSSSAKLMEAKTKYLERYNTYKLGMEEINLEREKAGLKPTKVLTFEEWLDTQPLSMEEQKLFTKMKAQTPKEFKEQEK